MSNNSYTRQLESTLEEILNHFMSAPEDTLYQTATHDEKGTEVGLTFVSEELTELLDRANDLVYGVDVEGTPEPVGYSTEEAEA